MIYVYMYVSMYNLEILWLRIFLLNIINFVER